MVVDGAEGRHAATVKRLERGEPVLVGDGHGRVVEGRVSAVVGKDRIDVEVTAYAEHPAPSPRVVVVQALAKGERGELSVELLTEVGVDVVVPWSASRSVAQWRGEQGRARRGEVARDRARGVEAVAPPVRARRARPRLAPPSAPRSCARPSRPAAPRSSCTRTRRCGWPRCASRRSGDVVLVVGPEGGISDDERATFESAGALSARLGPIVLRTCTAGTVAAAVVLASCGRWD